MIAEYSASNDDFIGLFMRNAQQVRVPAQGWTVLTFSPASWHEDVGKAARPKLRDQRRWRVTNPHEVLLGAIDLVSVPVRMFENHGFDYKQCLTSLNTPFPLLRSDHYPQLFA